MRLLILVNSIVAQQEASHEKPPLSHVHHRLIRIV